VLHVPFVLHLPGGPAGRVERPVSGVDVTPTVLDVLGLPAPAITDGRSVLAPPAPDRVVLAWRAAPEKGGGVSLRLGPEKILRNLDELPWERYDLSTDPGERVALPMEAPEAQRMVRRLDHELEALAQLSSLLRAGVEGEQGELSPETIDSLRALGYIGEDEPP